MFVSAYRNVFTTDFIFAMIEIGDTLRYKALARQKGRRGNMDKIERYMNELLEKSTPDRPIWNIEKILQGKNLPGIILMAV